MQQERQPDNRQAVIEKRTSEIAHYNLVATGREIIGITSQDVTRAEQQAIEEESTLSEMVTHEDQGRRLTYVLKDLLNTHTVGEFAMKKTSFGVYTTYNTPGEDVTSSGAFWRKLGQEEQSAKNLALQQKAPEIQTDEKNLGPQAAEKKPSKQAKKTPVEAQKIWKELVHEERLNKRLRKERLKLISVLSQILDKKQEEMPTTPPAETQPAEITPVITPDITAEDEISKKPTKLDKIKSAVKKHPIRTIAGVIGAGLAVAAIIFAARSCDSSPTSGPERTPTPSAAAGTPTPRPTEMPTLAPIASSEVTPTATPGPTEQPSPTPTAVEIVKTPNFGVRYNPNTGECALVDKNTGKAADVGNSFKTIGYQETGKGITKLISATAQPGQAIIIAGYAVGSRSNGVLTVLVAENEAITTNSIITDGFTRVVSAQDAAIVFCSYLQVAKQNGWAHDHVSYPDAWKVD